MIEHAELPPSRRPRVARRLPTLPVEAMAMFAAALALRVAYAWAIHGTSAQPSSDSLTYDTVAWNLARGLGFQASANGALYPTAFVPPALPYAVSLLYRAVGHSFFGAVLLMCFFGALVPPLVRQLGIVMFSPTAGRIAGWLAVVHPLLVFFSGYVMTEPLFCDTLLLAVLATVSWIKSPRPARAFGAGLLWGVATLTRPTAALLPVIVVLWAWAPLGLLLAGVQRLRHLALLLAGALLVVGPWTIRNAVVLRAFVPVTTGGGRSLFDANNPVVWDDPALRGGANAILEHEPWASRVRGMSEVARDRYAASEARAFLAARVREWPRAAWAKLTRFWRWTYSTPSTGQWFTGRGGLAGVLRAFDPLLAWMLVVMPLAAWGLVRTWRGTRRHFQSLPLGLIAAFTLGAIVYWGALRMRVPVEPLLLLYAGAGAADLLWRFRMRRAGLELLSQTRS